MNDEWSNTGAQVSADEGLNAPLGKSRKGLLIALIAAAVLVAGGLCLWLLVFRKADTPESLAQQVVDASMAKDWKKIIDLTPDEVLEILLKEDAEATQKKNLTSVNELRSWALEHAASITDPMNGNKIQKAEVGVVNKMAVAPYIEYVLGGEGDSSLYLFLKGKDEIATVEINYVVGDGNNTTDRKDTVVTYRKGEKWYLMTGHQIVHIELLTVE